ncbi:hypothetical protein BD414DRAFT_479631 [Trametes punicea]|nr:hypothetical protein BD414DRAFT_479631 [Trametes punicea]
MRSPVLVFSLVAAAATTVSAHSSITPAPPLSPQFQGDIGASRMNSPRQYGAQVHPRPQEAITSQRHEGGDRFAANSQPKPPQPPHLAADHGVSLPSNGGNLEGGVSDSGPAVGSDAGAGGGSASSPDGDPASGTDVLNFGDNLPGSLSNAASSPYPTGARDEVPSQDPAYTYTASHAYGYHRMRRMLRADFKHTTIRRDEPILPGETVPNSLGIPGGEIDSDNPDDDSSGHDGADGVSQRESETDGPGPYGGHAHSGEVGSSEGGHVYNEPASNSG